MEPKKRYKINDPVWIYGISKLNNKLTKGTVIGILDLSDAGFDSKFPHYVISIPTEIEPLLEIRTWETMSQDSNGPIGSFRDISETYDENNKKINQLGYYLPDDDQIIDDDVDDPSIEEIHAAIERTNAAFSHSPLVLKEIKPKKKFYNRKKKV